MIGHKIIYIAGHNLNLIKEIFLDSNHLNKDGIRIHTSTELEEMRLSCKLAAETLDMIGDFVKPGIQTEKINNDKIISKIVALVEERVKILNDKK